MAWVAPGGGDGFRQDITLPVVAQLHPIESRNRAVNKATKIAAGLRSLVRNRRNTGAGPVC